MSFVATAIAGTAIASAWAANEAGDAAEAGAEQAGQISNAQYRQTRGDLLPWQRSGKAANTLLQTKLGIGPQVNESNPVFRKIYDRYVKAFDDSHRAQYGIGIDESTNQSGVLQTLENFRKLAAEETLNQDPGANTDYGSLLKPFTLEDFQADPGYEFRLGEGEKAINRMAPLTTGINSGARMKALLRFNQDFASNEFGNSFNRDQTQKRMTFDMLTGESNTGVNAATATGGFGANAATTGANAAIAGGQARGNAIVGGVNAVTGAVGTGLNYNMSQQYLNELRRKPTGSVAYTMGGV